MAEIISFWPLRIKPSRWVFDRALAVDWLASWRGSNARSSPYIIGIPPRLRPSQVIIYSTSHSIIYSILRTTLPTILYARMGMKGWRLRAHPWSVAKEGAETRL